MTSGGWWRANSRDGWNRATAALMAVAALVVFATFRDYGSTWDARHQRQVGQAAIAWFSTAGRDARALQGGETGNLNLYGGLYESLEELAAAALPFHPLESRHLVNALLALLGVVGTSLLARRLGGPRAGLFAAALLLTTPGWWGHAFANSKDIPFAVPFPWLVLALLRASDPLPRPAPRRVLAAGLALGACLAARPGGLILLLPLAALLVAVRAVPALATDPEARPSRALRVVLLFAAVASIAWAGMLAAWPYGLLHPLAGPIEAVGQATRHPWGGHLVRFAGAWYPPAELPRSYAPGYLLATLPESWFAIAAGALAAAAVAWRRDRCRPSLEAAWLDPALVAAAGLGPILAAVATRPIQYDGVRHLLFVLTALAALGGWALSAALQRLPRRVGGLLLAVVCGSTALALSDAIRLHPYQYVYFNRAVAGGIARAASDYDLDYGGATGREAIAWVEQNVPPRDGRPLRIATSADRGVASDWVRGDQTARDRFAFDLPEPADLRLATTRWLYNRATGRILHVIRRMGVPLLYVIDATPAEGPLVLEAGDLAVALSQAGGWWGTAALPLEDDCAPFELRRARGAPAVANALVISPRCGPVPDSSQLRVEVVQRASELLGLPPAAIRPREIEGPQAHGWLVTGTAVESTRTILMAAARVADAAILVTWYPVDPAEGSAEAEEWIRSARLADASERRPP